MIVFFSIPKIGYLQRLAKAMDEVFFERHGVAAGLVADMYLDIFKPNGQIWVLFNIHFLNFVLNTIA